MADPNTFQHNEVARGLLPDHRDCMLRLVLTWAELDSSLRILLAKVLQLPLADGAFLIDRMPTSAVFGEIRKAMRKREAAAEILAVIKAHKKAYVQHSKPRNLIAHSKCVGHWASDPDYLIFATFESMGQDELAVNIVPMQEMERSNRWARAVIAMAMRIVGWNDDMGSAVRTL